MSNGKGGGCHVREALPPWLAEVAKYYKSAMPKNGWTLDEGASMGDTILSFKKGDRSANVMLSEEGSTTNVTIIVQEE